METATSGKCIDKTKGGIRGPALTTTYRFNKTIATATISFIVTVAIVVYKGSISVVGRMLTHSLPFAGTRLPVRLPRSAAGSAVLSAAAAVSLSA